MDPRKLLLNQSVEVRQFDEGLQGSWYSGVVVGVSNLCREIKYNELLSGTGRIKLVESIPVSEAIDGLHHCRHIPPTYRGRIRPLPASSGSSTRKDKLEFGLCVDAFYEDAWWEGVIIDCDDGAQERSVYFPDECDLQKFSVSHLRVTRVWDEFLDVWTDRGVWVLLELVKELQRNLPSCSYIEKLWNHLRSNYSFVKMISEWTCNVKSLWKKIILEVVSDIGGESRMKNLDRGKVVVYNVLTRRQTRKNSLRSSEPDKMSNQFLDPLGHSKDIAESEAVESIAKKEAVIFNDSRKSRNFSKSRLKTEKPIYSGDWRRSSLSRTYRNKELQEKASNFNQSNDTLEGTCGFAYGLHRSSFCAGPNQSHLLAKVKSQILLHNPPKVRKKNTGKAHIGSLVDTWFYVKGLRSRKSRVCKKDLSFFHVEYGGKDHSRDASVLYCDPRKKLTMKNRTSNLIEGKEISKNQLETVVRTRPLSIQENKEGLKVESTLSGSGRRLSPAFERLGQTIGLKDMVSPRRKRKGKRDLLQQLQTVPLCSICHNGKGLVFCSHCHSAYHLTCVGSQVVSIGDIPREQWFCPACCCGLCGLRYPTIDDFHKFTNICFQCNRLYHVNCLLKEGQISPSGCSSKRFCSNTCYKLCVRLHEFIGTSNCTGVDGLTWTMVRSMRNDSTTCGITRRSNTVKISQALQVIEESFEPIIELHSNRNLIKDVVYNYVSKHRRIDFRGFYLLVLQKEGDVATVATVRIHGRKVAEMPLVATCFQYRRQGICHILMQQLEKLLSHLGIEKLVLSAATQLQTTWESSFGFSEMSDNERMELIGYPLLVFQGTTLMQKSIQPLKENTAALNKEGKRTRRNMSQIIEDRPLIPTRQCSLCWKSRRGKSFEEGDTPNHDLLGAECQYVYKRRRILAGRD